MEFCGPSNLVYLAVASGADPPSRPSPSKYLIFLARLLVLGISDDL